MIKHIFLQQMSYKSHSKFLCFTLEDAHKLFFIFKNDYFVIRSKFNQKIHLHQRLILINEIDGFFG